MRDDGEDGQRRAEVGEEERPERARPQRVADLSRRADGLAARPHDFTERRRRRDGGLAHAQPDERHQHDERAHAQDDVGRAPAISGDQPLRERAHHQHAGAHAREGQPQHAAATLGEPPRDQRAARHPAHRAQPGRGQHPDHQVERPQRADPARQHTRHAEQAGAAEHDPARPQAVHEDAHHRREHALHDRRDREGGRGGAAGPAEFVEQRHEEDRKREVEAGGDRQRDPHGADHDPRPKGAAGPARGDRHRAIIDSRRWYDARRLDRSRWEDT